MNQSILSVRVDNDEKKLFEKFCESVGLNVSNAINMFIKAVLRENRIPFEIKGNDFEKEVYLKLLEAEKEMKKNSKEYSYDEFKEMMDKIVG